MYIKEKTLDDILHRVISKLLAQKDRINTTRGATAELTGVLFQLTHPRFRLSRTEKKGTLFSCIGELLWYLSKDNNLSFISYYVPKYEEESDNGVDVYGGYGPRLFSMRGQNQIANVIKLLKQKPSSRRAVIQLFDAEDIAEEHKEIPCTCMFQFMVRKKQLHMFTTMRSNDAFLGLPHDIFAFTMLQEIMARMLGFELGTYKHFVGSLHLYDEHREKAQQYIKEGWQSTISMPMMPVGDPMPSIELVLKAESKIRDGHKIQISKLGLNSYWEDFVRLLVIFSRIKSRSTTNIKPLQSQMVSKIYNIYIEKKQNRRKLGGTTKNQ